MVVVHSQLPPLTPYLPLYADGVQDGSRALLDGSISAVVGGSLPLLKVDEDWPRCKTCDSHLVPYLQISVSCPHTPKEFRHYVRPLQPEGTTLFQIFVCATVTDDGTCFEGWVNCVTEGESWLVRTVHFAVDGHDLADPASHDSIRSALEEDEDVLVVPERVISRWTPGKPEAFFEETPTGDDEEDDDDAEDYQDEDEDEDDSAREGRQHLPVKGLKLLGYPVQGKYYNSSSEECEACEASGASNDVTHNKWCMLVQLGTQEEDNPLYTTGNIFLQQCTMHPNVFEAVCSGNW
ncbi:hypothetical protein BD414DRAFT_539859 [Trametes punicea]|nr:hypothetical protein BD414DRAFT_539859 [Trametes punicea]